MFELLWYIPKSMIFKSLMNEENYGYGLLLRKFKQGFEVYIKTFNRHKECYNILSDILIYKEMNENQHPPLWVIKPQFEQDKAYQEWYTWLDFLQNGARKEVI